MKKKLSPAIGERTVQEKTGKSWAEWFQIIDNTGGAGMSHQEIVAYLKSRYQLSLWWQQMIAVSDEQHSGKRDKHQKNDGYQISKSRTFNRALPVLWENWISPPLRQRWLGKSSLTIGKTTYHKSLRMKWVDKKTVVDVQFYPKAETKTQLTVQHSKIADSKQAEQLKEYWHQQLNNLMALLDE